MITKEFAASDKVRVTFSMPAGIWADTIHLVGDFNNWNCTATPLRLCEYGWSVSLELDAGKEYQYRYLVNGTDWYNDWRADRYEPNEFGGDNSVVMTHISYAEICAHHKHVNGLEKQNSRYRYGYGHNGHAAANGHVHYDHREKELQRAEL